ncbi:RdgB/HAM1 family non-canonical purine NTP pyrophosphatase [Sphingomonas sp. QA11]|uniref:RdgB/HAM1 family non-canonical purine NTP pyrophosphatase n=1 Tax=Sphingomonas sp. QA11 TaxID=2950605 RepID=UPI002349A777|nr:RdgB/HAM1 family non-canonical purine NTP pyrophosphatase [Sphingomonas sp. QA11]WCM25368.1 RdgB/HAM1 family non-canonical purine NTP pyrophosphatase [Sphingomonas sp. QA11]
MTDEVQPQAIRKLVPGKLVIASHNPGKVREILEMLGPYGIEPVSAAALDLPEPEETGTTFLANAELKALQAADLTGLPALADDSGLCVDALNGDPGIFSARWAGEGKDFKVAMQRVNDALEAAGPDASRDAHFMCVLALAWPDGHVEWFEGRVDGSLTWPPRGTGGFGYNPIFVPEGSDQTFAEMPDAKKAISHRARAFDAMMAAVL